MPENDHPFAEPSGDRDTVAFLPVGAKVINTARAGAQMEAPPRRRVEKAYDDGKSEALEEEPRTGIMSADEVIIPPLQLELLVNAFEESNALRQNIDAMTTNVDGFGFDIVSSMPTVGADAREFVEDLLFDESNDEKEATSDEVKEKLAALIKITARERRKARNFFSYAADESFIELRRSSREDLEVLGNFTWEVLRDKSGRVARFVHLPFYTMRLTKLTDPTKVTIKRKVDPITFEEFEETRRFRKFIQEVSNEVRYYKEFGDPRLISKKNGRIFKDKDECEVAKKDDKEEGLATEVLHYKIRALRGPYGLPRYAGNLLSIRGSRLAEEVNFFYFQNRAIPPMMIFVENGTLADSAVKRLEEFFEEIKGDTRNFWKVAILEGESQEVARRRGVAWSGQPRFKVVKLSSEQLKDALFQEYDANNRDKVGESFRLPRLLRGDVRDFNRATAEVAKAFGEEQVFQPERDRFDAWINRVIMPALDFRFVEFKSLSSVVRDPFSLTEMTEKLVKAGILIPEEGRQIAEDIFNRDFAKIEEDWVKRPIPLTIAGRISAEGGMDENSAKSIRGALGLGEPGDPIDVSATVSRLRELRNVLAGYVSDTPAGAVYAPGNAESD